MTPQFRVLGGSCPRHEETVETLFPVIFLGRAAENNVGQDARVHDIRTMWSSYDQSCKLGGPARKKAGRTRRKKSRARGFCPRHEENEHLSCFLCCSVVGHICQDKYPGINQEHEGNMSRCRKAKIRNFS